MRKKGVIIFLVVVLIFLLINYFTRDYRIEKMLERIGESIAGAKVEIDNFHFSLFKMECSWDRLQIADKNAPWKNLLETGRAQIKLETRPLFWRRIIIKNAMLENVRSGTPRTSDGSIPPKPKPKNPKPTFFDRAKKSLGHQLDSMPVFDISGMGKRLKVDSLVDVSNLMTVQGYEKLKIAADSSFQYWQSQIKPDIYLSRLNELEKKLRAIKIEEMKDIKGISEGLQNIKNIQKEAENLKKEISEKHSALSATFSEIQTQINLIEKNLQQDIDRAKQLAHLKDLSVKDVSLILFGEPLIGKIEKILGYVALARKYIPYVNLAKGKPEKTSPPRLKGQDIDFPFHYRYPKFLLRNAKLSAATAAGDTTKAYFIEGNLTGLTNQPPVYGFPTKLNISLRRIDGNQYNIFSSFDHRDEIPRDTVKLEANNFRMGRISLKKQKYFPTFLNADKGNVQLTGLFIGDKIDLSLNLIASPVKFIFENKANDKVSQIVRDVLNGISLLNLNVKLFGESANYQIKMNSNVDKVLADQIKLTLTKNLKEAQLQVENYVRQQAKMRKQKVEQIVRKNREEIFAKVDMANKIIEENQREIDKKKKQFEQKLEEEKNKLKNKARDKFKNLFKKP